MAITYTCISQAPIVWRNGVSTSGAGFPVFLSVGAKQVRLEAHAQACQKGKLEGAVVRQAQAASAASGWGLLLGLGLPCKGA